MLSAIVVDDWVAIVVVILYALTGAMLAYVFARRRESPPRSPCDGAAEALAKILAAAADATARKDPTACASVNRRIEEWNARFAPRCGGPVPPFPCG